MPQHRVECTECLNVSALADVFLRHDFDDNSRGRLSRGIPDNPVKELLPDSWWARIAPLIPPEGRPGPPRTASAKPRDMTIKRLDHVSVVVDDLAAAIAFFTALGMTLEGEMPVEGPWVDRVNGLEGVQVDIVMMRTPDGGHGRLELTKFRHPKLVAIEPAIAPPNTLGLRSVMFTVDSIDDTVARLRANGAELVGEVVQYQDKYRLCYMRGPAGIIVALAEELF